MTLVLVERVYRDGIGHEELKQWVDGGWYIVASWGHRDGGIVVHWQRPLHSAKTSV